MDDKEAYLNDTFQKGYGEIVLDVKMPPPSQQSPREQKELVAYKINEITTKSDYLIYGEVRIDVQLLVHEQIRYETADHPDVDNVLKPILDALSGPQGLIIDDSQVQYAGCHWLNWESRSQEFNITINFHPDEFISKNGLRFIQTKKWPMYPVGFKHGSCHSCIPCLKKEPLPFEIKRTKKVRTGISAICFSLSFVRFTGQEFMGLR